MLCQGNALKAVSLLVFLIATSVKAQQIAEIFVDAAPHTYHFRGIYGLFGPTDTLQRMNLYEAPMSEACEPFDFTPPESNVDEKFVFFVMRGGQCTYMEKVKNCEDAGASGVLVGNYALNQIMFMNGNGTVDVPSVSVTGETVIAISSLMRKHEVKISFLPGPDLMSLQKGFVLMMVNTLIILLVFGGSMGMFSFFMWYKRTALERRLLREAEEVKRLARVKVEAIVNSLDVGVYTKPVADDLESGVNCIDIDSGEAGAADSTNTNSRTAFDNEVDCCAICLEEMEVGDQIRVLPLCVHGANFHLMCLDQWLMDVQSCPMCKARLAEDESECESECDEAENGNVNASDGPESEGHSSEDDEDNNSSTLLTGSSNRTSGSVRDTEVGHVMSSHFLNGNDAEDGGEDDDVDDSGDGYVRKSHLLPASDDTDIDVSDVARGEINSKGITAEHRPASSTEHTEVGMELRSIFRNDNASKMHEGNIRISKSNISENISGRESLRVDDDQERGDECDTDEQTRLV